MAFNLPITVRFGHCDPAGIVFYPRYMEMVNTCVETWFDERLGFSFNRLHLEQKVGVPTVHIDSNFYRPSRLEDKLNLSLQLLELGDKSITLSISINGVDEQRALVKISLVLIDLETVKSIPWQVLPELQVALQKELED